jgi:thioredoxin reductase (NADPH)
VRKFNAEVLSVQAVVGIETRGSAHAVKLSDGNEVRAHAVVVSTGVAYRKLEAPGVADYTGAGVYYGAAMTEAPACRDEHVVVIGGANSAGQAALYFATNGVRQVSVVVRGDSLEKGMSQYLVDRIHAQENIDVRLRTAGREARGDGQASSRRCCAPPTATRPSTPGRMFIFIGAKPETDWLDGRVERDERGFVLSGPTSRRGRRPQGWPLERDPFLLETNVPGVFVAGDVRHGSLKRVASSVGEGAMAVRFVHEHLAGR